MITLTPLNNPEGITQQEYSSSQEALIPVVDSTSEFNPVTDQIIFSVETVTGELLQSDKVSNFAIRNYENTQNEDQISSVVVHPIRDLQDTGYDVGTYNVYYNFYRNALKSSEYKYFIQEISPTRTELRLSVNNVESEEINSLVEEFKSTLEGVAFKDFYVNIDGTYYIANNIAVDATSVPSTILIKLYQPLPPSISVNTQLQVVLETAETIGYNLNLPPKPIIVQDDVTYIKGPNFSYQLSDQVNNSTGEQDYSKLVETTALTSSYNELQNILTQKGIQINVDYTQFENFIQYSSAEERLANFYYKVGQIEKFNNNINDILSITGSTSSSLQVSASIASYESQITDFIKNFDGYENYLYYTSGALAYPKSNDTQPYKLQSTGSEEVLEWLGSKDEASSYYGGRIFSASQYDDDNLDNLVNSIPEYLRNDPNNSGYEVFLNMIGQHFDTIYSYVDSITERYNADNRLDYGVSKDLVADALRGAGLKLYQNNFSSDNLYASLLGISNSGSLLPPTGSEVIETYVTASNLAIPLDNINKETYKRLYHNLPYLLKKKGTVAGLRALINCYGIPDTILRISEFGGKDIDNSGDWDYYQSKFNYAGKLNGQNSDERIFISDYELNSDWGSLGNNPETIAFRFRWTGSLPEIDQYYGLFNYNSGNNSFLGLDYTGSAYVSSSAYSGSIVSESIYLGTLTYVDGSNDKVQVTGSFFDGNWWGVALSTGSDEGILRVANKIYNGQDGFKIGESSTDTPGNTLGTNYSSSNDFYFPSFGNMERNSNIYTSSGDFVYQELRFYNTPISEETFHDFVMNPFSIEGSSPSSSAENLAFRAPIGSTLDRTGSTTKKSIHPKSTGSIDFVTSSFVAGQDSNYYFNVSASDFAANTEFIYYDQPAVGIKNRVSEKIRSVNNIVPSGDTLSAYRTIQQRYPTSESYTRDVNYVEVAFSPQNEINDDINSSFGHFNIGEYIGDPLQISESVTSYPDLDQLRDSYFEKYTKNYNWKDYIRLIKYFDNSLFKMIQDFTPANSALTSGVVIKQHLLERNKQRPPQAESSRHDYSGSIESGFINGNNALDLNINTESKIAIICKQTNRIPGAPPTSDLQNSNFYLNLLKNTVTGDGILTGDFTFDQDTGKIGLASSVNEDLISKIPLGIRTILKGQNLGNGQPYTAVLSSSLSTRGEVIAEGFTSDFDLAVGQIMDIRFKTVYFTDPQETFQVYLKTSAVPSPSAETTNTNTENRLEIKPTNTTSTEIVFDIDTSPSPIPFTDYYHEVDTTNFSQSFSYTVDTPYGPQPVTQSDEREFYNGEYSGSNILVTDGNLNFVQVEETDESFTQTQTVAKASTNGYPYSTDDGYIFTRVGVGGNPFNYSQIIVGATDSDGTDISSELDKLKVGGIFSVKSNGTYGGTLTCTITSITKIEVVSNTFNYVFNVTVPLTYGGDFYIATTEVSGAPNDIYTFPGSLTIVFEDSREINTSKDANPILNNVDESRLSDIYMDIDYSSGLITPTNISVLENRTATKAPVPDSNYSQATWRNGRYDGSRVSSPNFNL